MRLFHDEASHIGFTKAVVKLRESLYWPHMGSCFKKYVSNFRACTKEKTQVAH